MTTPNLPIDPVGNTGQTPLEQSAAPDPAQLQHQHEQQAFKTHIETSQTPVPDNFANAEAWFDSLKEAQKQYTQTRQELSEVKQQLEQAQVPSEPPLTDQLRIPKVEEPETPPTNPVGVDDATYEKWGMEFAQAGELSEATQQEIMQKTGFTERMVRDYIDAQKSKLRESYTKAATVVGGKDELDKIFKWAARSLNESDMASINMGLASPSYEVTLRGLRSMYQDALKTEQAQAEPSRNPNLGANPSGAAGMIEPFANQREFRAARNDPRFKMEPSFRDLVQKKMAITDWNTLPQ